MQPENKGGATGSATQGGLVSASWLAGVPVVDSRGEPIGEFAHVMLDVSSGTIAFGVLACPSLFGSVERLVAVPWQSLVFDAAQKIFVVDIDRERLRHAPQRDRGAWPMLADALFAAEMHDYYGAPPRRG